MYGLHANMYTGKLVIRNKALGGGRSTARITRRIMKSIRKPQRTISEEGQLLEEISEVRMLVENFDVYELLYMYNHVCKLFHPM